MRRICLCICILILLAACQPTPIAPANAPTAVPFPTVTPGRVVRGQLALQPLGADAPSLANPATAIALANAARPTADTTACPAPNADAVLSSIPTTGRAMSDEIVRFLSEGGSLSTLGIALREVWNVMGETGFVQTDTDITGEGTPEIFIGYTAPDDGGTLLILGCVDGTYETGYQAITGGDAPEILWQGDMNADSAPEILFASRRCTPPANTSESTNDCLYRTQMITWQAGRFFSLLPTVVENENVPTVADVDNDRILEVVLQRTNDGNADTGPLRTGTSIYDWNGAIYTLSIVQPDPLHYRIQVIHEADRVFSTLEIADSIPLYEVALNDTELREWIAGDNELLRNYVLYRLLLAYAYTEDDRRIDVYGSLITAYPDPAARPIHVTLADTFWNALQVTNNLHTACLEVQEVAQQQPDAVGLLNRYGSRSPIYTVDSLCPF